ncbi:hypothetical protein [Methanoplanus limicola]|uniref:Uncharacterized protein n=1 Tax=Methanoplanus limicola DSM 2279 TaxID=937775 RepID=H1Z013_9EURY|nr:hypothetical protein [Methanoplanus limicola]EHQ35220.1 hypothetical protein Metlim_1109 [Methanoplanus limicola DSM 2279]
MILQEGDLQFEFNNVIDAFKFDEKDRSKETFHGLSHCMKAVDFIIETEEYYHFVEVKDYSTASENYFEDNYMDVINSLNIKFRDSFLYRWAEDRLDKPIIYVCLLELENPMIPKIMKDLRLRLPSKNLPGRWRKKPVDKCFVVNVERWNKNFPDWKITRI